MRSLEPAPAERFVIVESNRLGRIIALLASSGVRGSLITGVCQTALVLLDADSVGLAVFSGTRSAAVCVEGAMAEVGEQIQLTIGEGPGRDAMETGVLVESDRLPTDSRWPVFSVEMGTVGALSVASFPLKLGGARVGAISAYRHRAERLTVDQAADGYTLATLSAYLILAAKASVDDESLIAEMESGFARMAVVHQATGIVMGQFGIGADEALTRLRGAAFVSGRPIIEFAREVVEGRITLESEGAG